MNIQVIPIIPPHPGHLPRFRGTTGEMRDERAFRDYGLIYISKEVETGKSNPVSSLCGKQPGNNIVPI